MPTTITALTEAQLKAVDKIRETSDAWTDDQLSRFDDIGAETWGQVKPAAYHALDALKKAVGYDAYEDALDRTPSCTPVAEPASIAVLARPWISKADYDALVAGWVEYVGPVPA